MNIRVKTEKELADALKQKAATIEITGDLAKRTIKLRATGEVAWLIAAGAIGIVVYAAITTVLSGGTIVPAASAAAFSGGAAISILGAAATRSAITMSVSAGSVAVLTTLRGYKEVSRTASSLILKCI